MRSDKPFYLGAGRAREIADSLLADQSFTCHKTVDYSGDEPKVTERGRECAGAMIILERMGKANQGMRIAERLGIYDASALDMQAPVYETFEDWVEAQRLLLGGS